MKNLTTIILVTILLSCNTIKNLSGTTYKYSSKNRTLELIFVDSRFCKLKNTFHCNDLKPEIKEITIHCEYQKRGDTIFLKNVNCTTDTCKKEITISIPPQESIPCYFLNNNSRSLNVKFGPAYATSYQKYGLVPNIDIDTLYINRKKILLYKRESLINVGFIFK